MSTENWFAPTLLGEVLAGKYTTPYTQYFSSQFHWSIWLQRKERYSALFGRTLFQCATRTSSTQIKDIRKLQRHLQLFLLPFFLVSLRLWFLDCWCILTQCAPADLLVTLPFLFNMTGYLWRWVGGNNTCKLQGFFVEASYTTSIMTLVTISYQRLKAITDPFSTRKRGWFDREYLKPVIIWGLSLLVCTFLLQIYGVKTVDGNVACITTRDGFIVPQIYYSLHTALFFAVPLFYMIFTQIRIHLALRTSVTPTSKLFTLLAQRRHKKATKTLAALTIAFVMCWSPFMVNRMLIYFRLAPKGLIWRASQLLIFLNTGLDPLLYGLYDGDLKSLLRRVLYKNRDNTVTSLYQNTLEWKVYLKT